MVKGGLFLKKVLYLAICAALVASLVLSGNVAVAQKDEAGQRRSELAQELLSKLDPGANVPELALDNYLRAKNYPEDIIAIMPYEWKLNSFQTKCEYVAHTTQKEWFSDNIEPSDEVLPMLVSLTNNKTNAVIEVPTGYQKSSNEVVFKVTYEWQWDASPFFTLVDKTAIAWSSTAAGSPFGLISSSLMSGSYTAYGTSGGYLRDKTWPLTQYEIAPGAVGIGYSHDILDRFVDTQILFDVYKHKGYISAYVSAYSDATVKGLGGAIRVTGQYFHQRASLSAQLTFTSTSGQSGYPTIGIQPAVGVDYDQSNPAHNSWSFIWP